MPHLIVSVLALNLANPIGRNYSLEMNNIHLGGRSHLTNNKIAADKGVIP
jgi:hypothetical protein